MALIKAVPYKIHTVLTEPPCCAVAIVSRTNGATMATPSDNGGGIQFTFPPCYANGPTATWMSHMFDMRGEENGIEHRLTKIKHPWSREDQNTIRGIVFPNGGQARRMNRTIKDATVKRFHYGDHGQLRRHLADFIKAYNFGQRLKTLRGLTPHAFIVKCWTSEPESSDFLQSTKCRD